jgi:excisionase family DNA binding protein
MMEWTYSPDIDALYFGFGATRDSFGSVEHFPGVIVDYDKAGRPIGVEVLGARKHLPKAALENLSPPEMTYTLEEAAKLVGLDAATLRQQILRKRIRAAKSHGKWFVDQSALDEYLASRAPQGRRSRKKPAAAR